MPWVFLKSGRDLRASLISYHLLKQGSPWLIGCWPITPAYLSGYRRLSQKPKSWRNRVPGNQRMRKTTPMQLGTWNVTTLFTGIGNGFTELDNFRKTAVVDHEFSRLKVVIAALQETSLGWFWLYQRKEVLVLLARPGWRRQLPLQSWLCSPQ